MYTYLSPRDIILEKLHPDAVGDVSGVGGLRGGHGHRVPPYGRVEPRARALQMPAQLRETREHGSRAWPRGGQLRASGGTRLGARTGSDAGSANATSHVQRAEGLA